MAVLNSQKKIDEHDVTMSYSARLQLLARAWTKKWEGPLEHTQRLVKLWAS